jgi:putative transcription factor
MECESCGSKMEKDDSYLVLIEGAKLDVCFRCKKLGKIIKAPRSNYNAPSHGEDYTPKRKSMEPQFELVEDYGAKIRDARNSLTLQLNVLAERINEKESFLDRIEKQKTRPSESVARKLEKELGIKILEEAGLRSTAIFETSKKKSSGAITLGDILEIEKKKKKK